MKYCRATPFGLSLSAVPSKVQAGVPAQTERQLDFVFASTELGGRLHVCARNEPGIGVQVTIV